VIQIIIGSKSDFEVVKKALLLEEYFFDKPSIDIKVASAHRSPERVRELVAKCENDGTKVFIACAGGSAHLAGVVAAHTTKPVIGVPMKTEMSGGLDSLLSTVQMPAGVPVATVGVGAIENAVVLAVQILATNDEKLTDRLVKYKKILVERVIEQDRFIMERIPRPKKAEWDVG